MQDHFNGRDVPFEKAFKPQEPVNLQVWAGVGTPEFVYPELRKDLDGVKALQKKPDLAICLSGGGFRACSCALGWVRTLHQMGIVKQARYMCSNSGGSWFNGAFSYQEVVDNDTFLGPYYRPSELTLDKLEYREQGSYSKVIDDATIMNKTFVSTLAAIVGVRKDRNNFSAWTKAIGEAFLDPHNVGDPDSTFALAGVSADRAKAAGIPRVMTAMRAPDMPYPIIVGVCLPQDDERVWYSYEFAAQYCGVPASLQDVVPHPLGGILVEPFGAASYAPEQPNIGTAKKSGSVRVELKHSVPLVQAAGISSHAISASFSKSDSEFIWDIMNYPEIPYWDGLAFKQRELAFADGGGTDNLAIMPPLRRGVRKCINCVGMGNEPKGSKEKWSKSMYNFAGYYGACPEGGQPMKGGQRISNKVYNDMTKVFPTEKYDELLDELFELHAMGMPLVIRQQMRVVPNRVQGITGDYDVDIVWIFNGGLVRWLEQLPKDTRKKVSELAKDDNLPYISTGKLDYPPETTTSMTQLASWNMWQARMTILEMLAEKVKPDKKDKKNNN